MRDQFGLVPPAIAANYERAETVDRHISAAAALLRALRALDPRLDVEFVRPGADPELGVVPGRWHVVRHNPPPAPDTYIPITTESGGYREPDFGVLEAMKQRDLWARKDDRYFKPTPSEQKGPSREQLQDHVREDFRAVWRTSEGGMEKRIRGKK